MTVSEKRAAFRKLIFEGDRMPVLCNASDGVSARLAQHFGFDGCIVGGLATAALLYGVPDIGLVTGTEAMQHAFHMASCVDLPVIADADTAYGNELNARRTIHDLEMYGLCGAHFEDQIMPKRCGGMSGVQLEPIEVGIRKMEALVKYRQDPNFLIIARTDAKDIDEAIRRANAYYEAGADMVFHGAVPNSMDDIKRFIDGVKAPVVHCLAEMHPGICFSVKEIEEAGAKLCIWPLAHIMAYFKTAYDLMAEFKRTGETKTHLDKLMPIGQCNELLGIGDWNPEGI